MAANIDLALKKIALVAFLFACVVAIELSER